jgi:hypothetical protein
VWFVLASIPAPLPEAESIEAVLFEQQVLRPLKPAPVNVKLTNSVKIEKARCQKAARAASYFELASGSASERDTRRRAQAHR